MDDAELEPVPAGESKDGTGAADHDQPYLAKGERMNVGRHPMVTDRQFAMLQTLRSHIEAGDRTPGSEPTRVDPVPPVPPVPPDTDSHD